MSPICTRQPNISIERIFSLNMKLIIELFPLQNARKMKTILSREKISREMNVSRISDKSQQRTNVWLQGQREEGCSSTGYFSKMRGCLLSKLRFNRLLTQMHRPCSKRFRFAKFLPLKASQEKMMQWFSTLAAFSYYNRQINMIHVLK